MIDAIGSQVNKIPNMIIISVILIAIFLVLTINFSQNLLFVLINFFSHLQFPKPQKKKEPTVLNPKQVEQLSNSLVGKFMTADLIDGKEVVALKGTLISEHIAFEAEKRDLLQKLASISTFWPVEP